MPRQYAARADDNQAELVRYARELGAEVEHLHRVGGGCADLLVAFGGRWYVAEVKTERGKLRKSQVDWHARFGRKAPVSTWRTCDDVLRDLLGVEPV